MIEDICLNHNDPTVRNWFNFYGIEETYRQYALNNGLPTKPQYTFNDVKEYLNNYIPADQFKYENIRTILSQLPVGSQAAFWRDTFYFKDAVEKNEIDEELFHAVVSTILTKEQRDTLYAEGAKLINVEQRVKELSALYPQTYDLLSEQEKRERVVEEHLADLFVKSFKEVSLLDKFSNFIQELFSTIKDFFGFATNRDYIETVFDNIKSGKYKNSNIVYSENTTPSTYILKGRATSGVQQDLSESESDQVIRNLRAIYFDQKYKTDLDHLALINRTIEIAKSYYEVKNPVVNGAFEAKLQEFNFETGLLDSVDNPDYIDLIDVLNTRINEVSPFMFDLIEEDQGDNITDENADSEYANISDFNSANEAGFDNISGWLKMYISTVGNIVPVEINGETIEFIEAVDENKIYYGVARALNNSRNDFERFIKLIELGTIEGNTTANAFLNKLIRDITGSKDLDVIQNIQNDYLNTYLQTKDASVINNYINPSRAYILQNVLKGFDLWSRTDLFQTISPETGNTITFDANVNNSVNNQLSNWQQNIIDNQSNSEILNGLVAQLAITGDFNTKLNNAITNNLNVLDEFGININPETIKWLLINNAINTYGVDKLNLSAKDLVRQNAFNNEINNYGDKTVISSLLDTIRKYSDKAEDLFDADGIRGKLEILAKINGVFDENVYESSRKNAEGKTIYSFQWKTFDLEFINNLQDQSFVNDLMNKGAVNYRTDAQGNEIYLTESQDFFKNNYFLKQFNKFKNIVPYIKLASVDGLRQTSEENEGREGDGVTFSNILTKDFDLWRLNAAVNRTIEVEGEKLYWHYLGNLEAKRTADGVYLPEIKGLVNNGLTQKASSLLKEEVRKEYDRIKRVHLELKEVIENNNLSFNDEGIINLSSTTLRQYLNKDVYEKYHTGKLRRELVGDSYIYHSQGVRALEFTDSVNGILPKDFMKNELTNAALQNKLLDEVWNDEMLKNHWNNIFNTHKQKLINEGIIPNLDKRWKIGEQLDNQKFENYIVSSYINVLSFNQIMHGDPALIYKNDGSGTDMYKRFAGRNAAVSSMESYLINPDFGITEVKNKVKYVVGDEFKSKVAFAPENSIDQADAQNYATTEYKRYLLWSKGRLTKFLAQALDDIELGYELTPQQNRVMLDNNEYFNVDKTVGFNGYQYLKKGDWMLTKELTSILSYEAEKQLETLDKYSEEAKKIRQDENNWIPRKDYKFHHDLRQNMEGWRRSSDGTLVKDNKKKYDLYMPISASKMLNVNVFNPSTGWNNTDSSIVHIAAKNYGLQLENPAGKKRIIDPSQMLEIIFNEQDDTVTVKYKGENRKITDLESLYQQYLTDRDEVMSDLVYNQLFDGEEFDAENFFPKAVKSLINSGADPQTIKIFQVENGKPLYNPNIGITKDKFTNLLFAEISKGLKHKVSGDALAHVSSYGIRPIKQIRKVEIGRGSGVFDYTWSVLDRNDPTYKKINYDVIPLVELNLEDTIEDQIIYDPTLPTDALRTKLKELYESGQYYFSDELRHLKPRYNYIDYGTDYDIVDEKVISYHSESVMPPSRLDDQFINSNNKYNFGVRIPSQDKHSAVNVEWTNTIPIYYGNTIAVAKEVMFLSGHDHDIDKLFLQKPELYKYNNSWIKYGDGDKWVEYIEFLKDSDSNFKKQYQLLGIEKLGTVEFDIQVKDLLNKLRIPNYQDKNPYTINNQLLELKQLALTNDGTLNSKVVNEKIIEGSYKTPASMTVLQDLDKGELFRKVETKKVLVDALEEKLTDTPINLRGKINYWFKEKSNKPSWEPYIRDLKILLPYISSTATIRYVKKEDSDIFRNRNWIGAIDNKGNIEILNKGDGVFNMQTLFHEVIHLITLEELKNNDKFNSAVKDLLQYSKNYFKENSLDELSWYGFTNEKEFLAEAFSNPNFANVLNKIPYEGAGSVWESFVQILGELLRNLGINVNSNSSLGELLRIMHKYPYISEQSDRATTNVKVLGDSLFATTNELPAHIFNTHSNVHTKNTVGKVNINPYVNGNLGLIQAIRAGYKINPDFQITINDHQIKSFGYLSAGNQRIFDTLSTLISAATDEAKEQLNAKYKLNLDGAVIVKTMVSLGFDLDTSILFVNQPIIQQYFKQKENRFQTVYLESEYKSDEEIIESLGGIENGYLGEYGNNELSNNLKGESSIEPNILNKRILNDLLVFEKVNKQTSLLTRFLKVKKGFVDGLDQLDQLNEAVDALGFNLKSKAYKKFMENNPLNTHLTLKDENIYSKIPQVYNVIKNVLPTVNRITSKLLLSRSIPVQSVKQRVFEQLKNLSNDNKTKIEREIDSYIFMRSYLNENVDRSILTNNLFKRGDHATVGATFDKLKQKVTSLAKKEATTADEKLLKDLYGTSILKRLIVKTNKKTNIDELKLDTFAKLSPEQQDNLIESYGLLIKNLSYLSDDYIEFKNLPQQMFAYWVMKDGFQNKFGSVAKLFPVYMFKVHSSTIDKILNNSDEEQLEKLMSDSSINDVVKRIAQNNITSKNLKTFYKPNNLTSQPIHNNYIVDFSKLRNNESAIVNYPFEFNDNKLIFVPFYTRMSGASLELSRVLLKDKTVLTNTQGDFYELVRNSKILKDVIKVEYKPIAKNDIQYQSIMTQDLNYSNIDGVSDVENDGVSEDYEGEIIIKKGCDSSLD